MSGFVFAKWLHIFGVCGMVGATLCNGWLHRRALIAGQGSVRRITLSHILSLNRWVMAPSFIVLITSGLYMVPSAYWAALPFWLMASMGLTTTLVVAFIGGSFLEHQLYRTAGNQADNTAYKKWFMAAAPVGFLATVMSGAVLYLMIAKVG